MRQAWGGQQTELKRSSYFFVVLFPFTGLPLAVRYSFVILVLGLFAQFAGAGEQPLNTLLNEEVVFIENGSSLFGSRLETTLFKPAGDGPFPLVVINHGKAFGNPRFQARARYPIAAREFVRRGYVVMVPMRSGFSKSSGNYVSGGCHIEGNALSQAEDVRTALDYAIALPYVDREKILVIGQSHGGLTTMAFGTQPYPGVRGLINFAGGLKLTNCEGWEGSLVKAFEHFGEKNRYRTLWFYGDNDSYWPRPTIENMHAAYIGAGGDARWIAFGTFAGGDAHAMFTRPEGLAIWWPEVERFLTELGLPTARLPQTAETDPIAARLQKAARALTLSSRCQTMFQTFLDADYPRAFAVGGEHCGYAYGGADPKARAIDFCGKKTGTACRLVAVDDTPIDPP